MEGKLSLKSLTVWLFLAGIGWHNAWGADLQSDLVGDGKINVPLANFEAYISQAPAEGQYKLLKNRGRLEEVISHLYLNRALAEEAKKLGLDKDPLIRAEIENFRDRRLALARLDAIRKQPVPDMTKAARDYYKAHYEEFMQPEQVDVSHILIRWKGKRSKDEARKIAETARKRILAGEDFAKVADELSEDPSVKTNHGRLGWMTPDKVVTPFRKQVFKLEPGKVSEVFETPFGYHVAKVWAKKLPKQLPFEQVKGEIIARLEQQYREDKVQQYLESFRKKSKIGIEKKLLDAYVAEKMPKLRKELNIKAPDKPIQQVAEPLTKPVE